MAVLPHLLAFDVAAALQTITAGLATVMILRSAVTGGSTVIGIALGCLAWDAAVALSLGIVLTASAGLYNPEMEWCDYLLSLGSPYSLAQDAAIRTRLRVRSFPSAAASRCGATFFTKGASGSSYEIKRLVGLKPEPPAQIFHVTLVRVPPGRRVLS